MEFYQKELRQVFEDLKTNEQGLTTKEAQERLKIYGLNKIRKEKKTSALTIFLSQFSSPIIWILIVAMIISFIVKEMIDFYVIGAIVVINAFLGFVQEYRAEEAITKLMKLLSLKATVIRDGKVEEIDATELVPGDILALETGQKIPADARLIEITNLQMQEASLTGESLPVNKKICTYHKEVAVADRKNMVFSGTIVTKGHGKAVVTGTGMNTEIGKIATLIQETKPELTPLQKQLKKLGAFLGIAVILIALAVFGIGILGGNPWEAMLMAAIAIAVAAIPEGLPAVVTISLALGVQRMALRNALMRKLPSVETLGACSVICSDKTGTLTHNEMTVTKIYVNREVISVGGSGYEPEGSFSKDPKKFKLLLKIGALNNNTKIIKENKTWKVIGDPTEAALIVSAKKANLDIEELKNKYQRIKEIEFTSERKMMTTIHKIKNEKIAFSKGAVEIILNKCNRILVNGRLERLTKAEKEKILEENETFAKQALRILGFAYKEFKGIYAKGEIEKDMIFVGLQAMIDPPRKEVKDAIDKCKTAGIKVIMITGDYATTATAIAKELGITGKTITGIELDKIENLNEIVEKIGIYARVNPAHKLKIIKALQAKGHIVAMTGDGVNDAPALKKADLGIAMGITGTDVAKEASDMVLADDNFTTIVNAVEEGRRIFDNIKKFVEYLLSSNMGEILTVFTAMLLRWPLPITALQILWINLATDGLPALALGIEPTEPNIMKRPPRKPTEHIVNKKRGILILIIGLIMMLGTLFIFDRYETKSIVYAQTAAFATLVMFQMFNVLNQRSEDISLFKLGFFTNKKLLGAVLISVMLQVVIIFVPFFNKIFGTTPLKIIDIVWVLGISSTVLIFGEIVKFFRK
ncbi:ATPase [Candidatus Woesearchaeota archaeon ex4484_78]|nr:MAG: ATPase [Candidatus Woesearchaeota archaeon ex4484_78]